MDVRERLIEMSDGTLVEEDALRIAQKINDYDENLLLKFCANPTSLTDAPYALFELCPDGIERKVFDIWELDDRVIERIWQADNKHQDIEAMLNKENERAKRDQKRRYEEIQKEQSDIAKALIRTDKETYQFDNPITGDKVKVHQKRPVEVESNERSG